MVDLLGIDIHIDKFQHNIIFCTLFMVGWKCVVNYYLSCRTMKTAFEDIQFSLVIQYLLKILI